MDHGRIVIYDAFPVDVMTPDIAHDSLENPTLFSRNVAKILDARNHKVEYPQKVINRNNHKTKAFSKEYEDLVSKLGSKPKKLVEKFTDGETDINVPFSIRDADVYLFQYYIPPLGEREKEMFYISDACKFRGMASRVVIVAPYCFGQRGERQTRPRQPVPAQIFARSAAVNGAAHVLTTCEHNQVLSTIFSGAGMGYDQLPYELLTANCIINGAKERGLRKQYIGTPDLGATKRAGFIQNICRRYGKDLSNIRLVIANKDRYAKDKTRIVDIIGNPRDQHVTIVDDLGSTLGSLVDAVHAYERKRAQSCSIVVGHAVLAEGYERNLDALCDNDFVDEIVFANTLPLKGRALTDPKVKLIPLEPFFAEAIWRLNSGTSISAVHKYESVIRVYKESGYDESAKFIQIR